MSKGLHLFIVNRTRLRSFPTYRTSKEKPMLKLATDCVMHFFTWTGTEFAFVRLEFNLFSMEFLLLQNLVQSYTNLISKIKSPTFPERLSYECDFGVYQLNVESWPFPVRFALETWSRELHKFTQSGNTSNATWPERHPTNLTFQILILLTNRLQNEP